MRVLAGAAGSTIVFCLALGAPRTVTSLPAASLVSAPLASAAPAAPPMSGRAAKAANKTARASMQSGRLREALEKYESVLASTPSSEEARGEALYWAGLLRISPDPAVRDIDRARAYLGELKVFHGASGHQEEAALLLALTDEIGEASRSAEALRAEIASRGHDNESCRAEKDAVNAKLQAALSENESLKESDSVRRTEIAGLRDELKRKDEALQKVKEVVVGWKAPR